MRATLMRLAPGQRRREPQVLSRWDPQVYATSSATPQPEGSRGRVQAPPVGRARGSTGAAQPGHRRWRTEQHRTRARGLNSPSDQAARGGEPGTGHRAPRARPRQPLDHSRARAPPDEDRRVVGGAQSEGESRLERDPRTRTRTATPSPTSLALRAPGKLSKHLPPQDDRSPREGPHQVVCTKPLTRVPVRDRKELDRLIHGEHYSLPKREPPPPAFTHGTDPQT